MLDFRLAFAPQFPAPGLDPSTLAASEGVSQFPAWFAQRGDVFVGFCALAQAGLPKFAPVHIRRLSNSCYRQEGRWRWRKLNRELTSCVARTQPGLVTVTLTLTSDSGEKLGFLHRRWVSGDEAFVGEAAQPLPPVFEQSV